MNLTARISYQNPEGEQAIHNLGAWQTLLIGSSMAADIQVYNDANVAEKHCQLHISDKGCYLKDLTGGRGITKLDGVAVDEAELGKHNTLMIGANEIFVEVLGLEVQEKEAFKEPEVTETKPEPEPEFVKPNLNVLKNGLRVFEFEHRSNSISAFARQVAGDRKFFLTENQKTGGLNPPDPQEDLLKEFPDSVTSENSLTLSEPVPFAELAEQFEQNLERDCSVLIAPADPEISRESFVTAIRPLVAWFLKPSNFNFHMRNGIEFLLEKTFADILFVALFIPQEKSWTIVSINPEINEFDELKSV